MQIKIDDLTGPDITALLEEHILDMRAVSPPGSKHALDLPGLRRSEITFWTIWDGAALAGCGALRQLDATHGEIKSMRTARSCRHRGVAAAMLTHIIAEARHRGYRRVSLETGAMPFFAPARSLYLKFGFAPCGPFGNYQVDPNSVFFSRELPS